MTKFCSQCGSQVTETQRFCNKCGAQLQTTQPAASSGYSAPTANYPNYETPKYQTPPEYQQPGYGQMPYQQPYQPPAASGDLKPNIAGALCYPLSFVTGILFLVLTPYNKDRFVRFHAFQSIFFFAAILALNIALGILGIVLPWRLERLLDRAVDLLSFGGTLWLIYQAYRGEKFKMPVIGDLAETQADKV
jgi:uncharacterized membrane protein